MATYLDTAIKAAKKAGKLILEESKKTLKIDEKAKNDFVTNMDKESEALIIKEIKKKYPSHDIMAEETLDEISKSSTQESRNSEYIWIIDPIDGTLNFIHGLPMFSISIALVHTKSQTKSKNFDYLAGEIVVGAIYAPKLGELFYAEKGKGAFMNKKEIQVSKATKLENSLTVTGFPATNKQDNFPHFEMMTTKSQGLRRLGSAALDMAYIANGRLDAFWEFGLKPWDIAAGSLIIEEAGGEVTDTNGNILDLFGGDILATNGNVHKEVIEEFGKL